MRPLLQQVDLHDPAIGTYVERLAGGGGSDLLRGFGSDDRLDGGAGGDILIGDDGANQYLGGIGDDLLIPDATAPGQQIDGGSGFDAMVYAGVPSIVPTFDGDEEGWTGIGGTVDASGVQPGQGGFVRLNEASSRPSAQLFAPAEFLGDQSVMMGGRITFDLEPESSASNGDKSITPIGGASGTTRSTADIPDATQGTRATYSCSLSDRGPWRTDPGSAQDRGGFVTDAMILDVLSNLTAIELNANRSFGSPRIAGLDNSVLSALPLKEAVVSQFESGSLEGRTTVLEAGADPFSETFTIGTLLVWENSGGNAGAR
jgi:hypothetical protein